MLIPLIPSAFTRSSTDRVDTPWMYAYVPNEVIDNALAPGSNAGAKREVAQAKVVTTKR